LGALSAPAAVVDQAVKEAAEAEIIAVNENKQQEDSL